MREQCAHVWTLENAHMYGLGQGAMKISKLKEENLNMLYW